MLRSRILTTVTLALPLTIIPLLAAQDDGLNIPEAPIPHLRSTARTVQDFAPTGWAVETQAAGDLNADGRADLAFVLHEQNPRLILQSKGFGVERLDTNPRILAIAFANADGSYTLTAENGNLITRWTESNMDDYFGDGGSLEIKRGTVLVGLHYFANMGGWDTGSNTFTFRYQHGHFELIGYENNNLNRATQAETKTSVNYSTAVQVITSGGVSSAVRTRRKPLPHRPLLTLEKIGSGMDFNAPE